MVVPAATEGHVCGFGEAGTVELRTDGWRPGGDGLTVSHVVDTAVVGETTGLWIPVPAVTLTDGDRKRRLSEATTLPGGDYRLSAEATLDIHVAFRGPASIEPTEGTLRIDFPASTVVTIGFSEELPPRPHVTVPESPAGLAKAVTAAAATHRVDGPERSHPGLRPRTPRVEFGDTDVPDALEDAGGPTFFVPSTAEAVLVCAPLAYYLGASVQTGSEIPRLVGGEFERTFEGFAGEIADRLQQLFTLDCLLRDVPGEGESIRSPDGIDLASLYGSSPLERLAAVSADLLEELPKWHLSTYVDDDPRYGMCLPGLLDRMSLVYPASSSALDPKALLERSLEEFYRGESPTVEAVDPSLSESWCHAWLAEGTPVDAYSLLVRDSIPGPAPTPAPDADGDTLVVDVVCNDPEMAEERDVSEVYRAHVPDPVEVRLHERLSVSNLAAVFETPTDLVHFIGHCERDGLRCPDGTLSAAGLDVRATSFFLNSCGSYYEGYDLVRHGAAVGAVTLSAVLDEQAVRLGTTFARLLSAGFAFDPALRLARGRIITGRDYAVVGDGTRRLAFSLGDPAVARIDDADDGFVVAYDVTTPAVAGRRYADPFEPGERVYGDTAEATLDRADLLGFLRRFCLPVRYEGDLHWSSHLVGQLRDGQQN